MKKNVQKALCLKFFSNGVQVDNLSLTPASAETVMSALHFLREGCEISLSIVDLDIDCKINEEHS